jgi:hypothetical protein
MAAGDSLFTLTPMARSGPATAAAALDVIAGASSPAESIPVLSFDAATDENADFAVQLPYTYAGGGLTFVIAWTSISATSATCRWEIAVRRFADDAEDLDTTSQTYDFNGVGATAPSAAGEIVYDNVTFTNGADMDSWAAGEWAILRVKRDADGTNGTDDMTGDGAIVSILCRETP